MLSLMKIFHIVPPREYKCCVLLFFLMLFGAILEAVGIGAILPLISAVGNIAFLDQHQNISYVLSKIGIDNHQAFISFCAIVLIVFYFFKNAFLSILIRMQIGFVVRNQIFYSRKLLAEYLSKPYLFHVNHNTATLLRNVNDGALIMFNSVVLNLLNLLTECVTSLAIGIMLVIIDPFTAIIAGGILGGLVVLIIKSFRKRISYQGKVQNDCRAEYLAWVNQSLGAIKETKVMHMEGYFLDSFDCSYRHYGEARGAFDFLSQLPRLLIEVVVVSGLLLLIIIKVFNGNQSEEIVPLLGLLALAAFRLMPSANRIISYYNTIKFQMPFFHELYPEFHRISEETIDRLTIDLVPEKTTQLPFHSEICINHLAFSYYGGQEILKDVTFRIKKGDFVGIIGASGVGKTTFVDVLLGLLIPSQGYISVDGVDIFSDIRGWQENLAYVPQTIYLIDASIKENIALGQNEKNIDMTWMETVLRMTELYEFVNGLQGGIETIVGERGIRLSGGQRQRIGIARALYCRPQVLILDEATSALDAETELNIMDTILHLKGEITIIAVAHRVSTLEECDYKVRFYDGVCEIVRE